MNLRITLFAAGLHVLGALASWAAFEEYMSQLPSKAEAARPQVSVGPVAPWRPLPTSAARHKTCEVKSHDDMQTDDSRYILEALHQCNHGGRVVFPRKRTYVVGKAMDMTFLKNVDIVIQGYVQFTNDTTYWQAHGFNQTYQNATTFFQLGGHDVNVYGGGMLDGNGQAWYDLYATNDLILRPILFGTIGLTNGIISNLRLRNSPQWNNFLANSTNVLYDSLDIRDASTSSNPAANTDGIDIYRSSNVVLQNWVVFNDDDCVSFKPNATELVVQNMQCTGSHGISVGSLGQYIGEIDIVENVIVSNISMTNATDGARIKVWPGVPSELSGDLQGGGGSGHVRNITYEDFRVDNVAYAIEVTQCYGQKNFTLCTQFPSNLTIADVRMRGFTGTASSAYAPYSGFVVCSSKGVCEDIEIKDVNVTSTGGQRNQFVCGNVQKKMLHGINCTGVVASGQHSN